MLRNNESDAGSMRGYDPNLGLGNAGYAAARQSMRPPQPNPMQVQQMNQPRGVMQGINQFQRPMNANSTMQGQMGAIQRNLR